MSCRGDAGGLRPSCQGDREQGTERGQAEAGKAMCEDQGGWPHYCLPPPRELGLAARYYVVRVRGGQGARGRSFGALVLTLLLESSAQASSFPGSCLLQAADRRALFCRTKQASGKTHGVLKSPLEKPTEDHRP